MGVSSTSASSEGRRNGRDRHRGVALHRWRCTRSHRTHTGGGARAVVSAQTALLDVGAARAAAPRFYAPVGGRCFRRRWPSGSNGTPAVHRRTIPIMMLRALEHSRKGCGGRRKPPSDTSGRPARDATQSPGVTSRGECVRDRAPVLAAAGIVAQLCA